MGEEKLATLDPHYFLILGLISARKRLPVDLQPHVSRLLDLGLLDCTGRGKPILSKRLYRSIEGATPRATERAIARQHDLALLREDIQQNRANGSSLQELLGLLPSLSRDQVKRLLKQLRSDGTAVAKGGSKSARWYPPPDARFGSENPS